MTVKEGLLAALYPVVANAASGVENAEILVTRNAVLAERLDGVTSAWANLLDGGADGEPQALMGAGWEFNHVARVEIYVRGDDDSDRDARFDRIVSAIAAAIAADPTLGGLAAYAEAQSVEEPGLDELGLTIGFKVGIVPILILYDAPTRAG